MIQLRLFRASDPFQPLEERTLDHGDLIIGRDPAAHWVVPDDACEVSRRHCVISVRGDRAVVRDTSSNGVYLGVERQRLARDTDHELASHETLHVGQFLIVVEPREVQAATVANDAEAAGLGNGVATASYSVRSDWDDEVASAPTPAADGRPLTDAALLDAFCAGAGLDASSFVGDDPVQVMRRAGAVYKQMVLGLGDVLSERSNAKAELAMNRTTISASGNNPFKWAPTRRVAVDLLLERHDGFLSGADALRASFEDIKKHSICLVAGAQNAVDHVLGELEPTSLQASARSVLGLGKGDACWRAFVQAHEDLTEGGKTGALNEAFKEGYEARLRDLDEASTKS